MVDRSSGYLDGKCYWRSGQSGCDLRAVKDCPAGWDCCRRPCVRAEAGGYGVACPPYSPSCANRGRRSTASGQGYRCGVGDVGPPLPQCHWGARACALSLRSVWLSASHLAVESDSQSTLFSSVVQDIYVLTVLHDRMATDSWIKSSSTPRSCT